MRTIFLHGRLKEKFGGPYVWQVNSAIEATRGMMVQFKGFRQEIEIGHYQIIVGDFETGLKLTEESLDFKGSASSDIHIIPVLEGAGGGSKSKGIGKIIVGVALAATAIVFTAGAGGAVMGTAIASSGILSGVTYGSVLFTGIGLTLAGISALMTSQAKTPGYGDREPADQRASFIFQNGAVNTSEQGQPVPLVFGKFLCGSIVISAGIEIEQIMSGTLVPPL